MCAIAMGEPEDVLETLKRLSRQLDDVHSRVSQLVQAQERRDKLFLTAYWTLAGSAALIALFEVARWALLAF